jgi:hypothetical protein
VCSLVDRCLEHDTSCQYVKEMGHTATLQWVSEASRKASQQGRVLGSVAGGAASAAAAAAAALASDQCLVKLGGLDTLPITPSLLRGLLRRALHPQSAAGSDPRGGGEGAAAGDGDGRRQVAAEQLLQAAKLARGQRMLQECEGVADILRWLTHAPPPRGDAALVRVQHVLCQVIAAMLRAPEDADTEGSDGGPGKVAPARELRHQAGRKKAEKAPPDTRSLR